MNQFSGRPYYPSPLESLKQFFRSRNILAILIIVNVAVWLLIRFLAVFFDLFNADITETLISWLAVPANPGNLVIKPWTPFTYMFLHYEFWHILFNMLWLYWFGRIFLEYLSERQLLSTYILGGLAGAAFYVISFNIFPKFQEVYLRSIALGASASVMAIVVGISFYVPSYRIYLLFFGPVKILYIAMASLILDVLMIRSDNSGGHLAHLGGAMWGFFYIYMLKNGKDLAAFFSRFPVIGFKKQDYKKKKTRFKNVYTNTRPVSDEDYNLAKQKKQEQIDKILDKISKSGYESLTGEEKELLFRSSNQKH